MSEDSKKPKRWFKRIAIVMGGCALAVIAFVLIWVWIGSDDIDPPDTSDLERAPVEIVDEDNAYFYFLQACEVLNASAYSSSTSEWHVAEVYQPTEGDRLLVSTNTEAYALLAKASSCERFIAPKPQSMGDVPIMKERQVIWRMLAVKCRIEQSEGRLEDAVLTCGLLVKLSRLMLTEPQCLLDAVIGLGGQSMSLSLIEKLAVNEEVPVSSLKHLLAQLEFGVSGGESMARGFLGDYHVMSVTLDEILRPASGRSEDQGVNDFGRWSGLLRSKLFSRYTMHPNRTQLELANYTRSVTDRARHPHKYVESRADAESFAEEPGWIEFLAKPNAVGKLMLSAYQYGTRGMVDANVYASARFEMTKVLVAMHLHHREHGAFPSSLEELEGVHLKEIPSDPFTAKSMGYLPEEQLIYCVGLDGVYSTEDYDNVIMHLWEGLK